jgi:membrane protease YdiL (CAAX protease family)
LADDPPASHNPPAAPGPASVALFAVLHLVAFVFVFALGASINGGTSGLVLNEGVAALVAPLLALYAALARWAPGVPLGEAVGLVRIPGGAGRGILVCVFAVVLGVALAFATAELTARVFAWLPLSVDDLPDDLVAERVGAGTRTVLALCLVLLVPFAEEMLYRGFLQQRVVTRALPRPGSWRAALVVMLFYSMVQPNLRFIPGALVLALGLMLAARWGGSTWSSIAAHVAFQATPLVLSEVWSVPLPFISTVPGGELFQDVLLTACAGGIAAVAAFALWRLRPR